MSPPHWSSGRSHEDAVKILIESNADKIGLDYTSFTTPLEPTEDEVNENVILPWVKRRPIIVTRPTSTPKPEELL